MGKLYTADDIGKLIGITGETVKNWEYNRLIPQAARIGLQKKRVWGELQVQRILEFARDNGYPVPERTASSEQTSQKETAC